MVCPQKFFYGAMLSVRVQESGENRETGAARERQSSRKMWDQTDHQIKGLFPHADWLRFKILQERLKVDRSLAEMRFMHTRTTNLP